jgi:aldehyde:ferredoxin oxidoreductase
LYYGDSLSADQALWEAASGCNRLGICNFEVIGIALWLRDLFTAGVITDQEAGLPLSRYGSKEFIVELLNAIAFRRNMGEILSEGAARAARLLPKSQSYYEKYYPAYGQSEHDSVRDFPGIALLWALDSRDPVIDHHAYRHLSVSRQKWPEPHTLSSEKARGISKQIFGSETAINHRTYAEKAGAMAYCQNRSSVINSLVLCDWLFPIFTCQTREDRVGDTTAESKLLSAVTGLEISEESLNEMGERIWNLQRATMVREGRNREDDTLYNSYFQEGGINREDFEKAKDSYYEIRGWNVITGIPTKATLSRLGLNDIAEELDV